MNGTGCSSGIAKEVRLKGKSCSHRFLSPCVNAWNHWRVHSRIRFYCVQKVAPRDLPPESQHIFFFFFSTRRQLYRGGLPSSSGLVGYARCRYLSLDWLWYYSLSPCRLASRYCSKSEEIGYRGGLYFLSWMLNIIIIIRERRRFLSLYSLLPFSFLLAYRLLIE